MTNNKCVRPLDVDVDESYEEVLNKRKQRERYFILSYNILLFLTHLTCIGCTVLDDDHWSKVSLCEWTDGLRR